MFLKTSVGTYHCKSLEVVWPLNTPLKFAGLPSFEVGLPNTEEVREALVRDTSVEVWALGEKVLDGLVLERYPSREGFKVYGEIEACKLDRTKLSKDQGQEDQKKIEYVNDANVILADVLSGSGFTVGSCPGSAISVRFYHKSRLSCCYEIARVLGKDLWFVGTAVYIGDKGSSKGSVDIEITDNDIDYESMINDLTILYWTTKWYTITVDDEDSKTAYGTYEESVKDNIAMSFSTATLFANAVIAELKVPLRSIEADVIYPVIQETGLVEGDTITIDNPLLEVSGDYRIRRIVLTNHEYRIEASTGVPLASLEFAATQQKQIEEGLVVPPPEEFGGDLDDIDDGTVYGKMKNLIITEGVLKIENRTDDPSSPAEGRVWLRTDL